MSRVRAGLTGIGFALALSANVAVAAPLDKVDTAVLDHIVEKGELLSAADFISTPLDPAAARDALRVRDAAGMEAVRRLSAGAVVRSSDVIPPQLVRRGEPVTIMFQDGPLLITTAGRSLSSGATGDFVRVVSLSTNRTLDGVVEGSQSVRIAAY